MRTTVLLMMCLTIALTYSCNKQTAALQGTEKTVELAKKEAAQEKMQEEKVESRDGSDKIPKEQIAAAAKNYYQLGFEAHNRGEFAEAIDLFSKCINEFPEYTEAWNFRGLSKFKSGNKSGACSDWRMAEEKGHPNAANMLADYCN